MSRLDADELHILRMKTTELQFEALMLWSAGFGWKRIGILLSIHPSTARSRVIAGLARVGLSLEALDAGCRIRS